MPASPSSSAFTVQLPADEDRLTGMIKGISEEHRAQVTSLRNQHTYALEQKDIELGQLRSRVHQLEREIDQAREESIRKDQEKSFAVHSLEEQLRALTGENYNLQGQLQLLRQSESLSSEKAASLAGYAPACHVSSVCRRSLTGTLSIAVMCSSQQVLKNMNETYQAALDQVQHERSALQAANEALQERLNTYVADKNKVEGQNRDLTNALEESRHKLQELMAAHTNVRRGREMKGQGMGGGVGDGRTGASMMVSHRILLLFCYTIGAGAHEQHDPRPEGPHCQASAGQRPAAPCQRCSGAGAAGLQRSAQA